MPFPFPRRFVLALSIIAAFGARTARAGDFQLVAVGRGAGPVTTQCVLAGPDNTLQSTAVGDDHVNGNVIETGPNGICETPLLGDDVRPPNGVTLGSGLPYGAIIVSAPNNDAIDDGICDDTIVALGDDVVRIPAGQGEPRALEILTGPNNVINSTPGVDDQLSAVICAGPNGSFQSTVDPGDALAAVDNLCFDLCASAGCIIPGADGILQSTAAGDDVVVPFVSTGPDGVAQTTAIGDDVTRIAPGRGEKQAKCVSAGPDGIAQTTICGNGITDFEENGLPGAECDDGNNTSGDGCSDVCRPEVCGNGIIDPGEECDDGNTRNNDACVLGCRNATCGDGYIERGVEQCEPPNTAQCDASCQRIVGASCGNGNLDAGEECDDGNTSSNDDCTANCTIARCGDGSLHTKGTGPFEECDDGNLQSGDGCSATCTIECGNGVIDGACSQGNVGASCSTDAECDVTPGDGVCVHEECDPGAAQLCTGDPVCSNACLFETCGNGVQECAEACDLGEQNGVPGSGCSTTCTRLLPPAESRSRECLSAFTVDEAPDLRRISQICHDGASCDFDQIPGQCTFRVGVCLNRTGVTGCTPGNIQTFELTKVNLAHPEEAAAAQAITAAVLGLAPGTATAPDRCREGAKRKICAIPNNVQCDSALGKGDGVCDIGAGVVFAPPLDVSTQVAPCTEPVDVVVPAHGRLRLSVRVKQAPTSTRPGRDNDVLRLSCRP